MDRETHDLGAAAGAPAAMGTAFVGRLAHDDDPAGDGRHAGPAGGPPENPDPP